MRALTSGRESSMFDASTSASAVAARYCVSASSSSCSPTRRSSPRGARRASRTRSPSPASRRRTGQTPPLHLLDRDLEGPLAVADLDLDLPRLAGRHAEDPSSISWIMRPAPTSTTYSRSASPPARRGRLPRASPPPPACPRAPARQRRSGAPRSAGRSAGRDIPIRRAEPRAPSRRRPRPRLDVDGRGEAEVLARSVGAHSRTPGGQRADARPGERVDPPSMWLSTASRVQPPRRCARSSTGIGIFPLREAGDLHGTRRDRTPCPTPCWRSCAGTSTHQAEPRPRPAPRHGAGTARIVAVPPWATERGALLRLTSAVRSQWCKTPSAHLSAKERL